MGSYVELEVVTSNSHQTIIKEIKSIWDAIAIKQPLPNKLIVSIHELNLSEAIVLIDIISRINGVTTVNILHGEYSYRDIDKRVSSILEIKGRKHIKHFNVIE